MDIVSIVSSSVGIIAGVVSILSAISAKKDLKEIRKISVEIKQIKIGNFSGNISHSNGGDGFRFVQSK